MTRVSPVWLPYLTGESVRCPDYPRPMVNLTRIYTRTGDAGQTRLGDMSSTSKNDLRLHAYADVDEANAQLGLAIS